MDAAVAQEIVQNASEAVAAELDRAVELTGLLNASGLTHRSLEVRQAVARRFYEDRQIFMKQSQEARNPYVALFLTVAVSRNIFRVAG